MKFVILFFQFIVILGLGLIIFEVGFRVAFGLVLVLIGNNFLLDTGGWRRDK